jgi:beta-xylosidase
MSPDGTKLLDGGSIVFDGHANDPTLEGPKFYKRNGYYYIFAPAGGVPTGWQLALRSKSVYGPYERKVVLSQGKSPVNGPHQGAWVDTPGGESWFLHFQDAGPYGRIVHLQPMKWVEDWPVMGDNGTPVMSHRKPDIGKTYPVATPPDSDEFNAPRLGLQWQWQANPQPNWAFPSAALGILRLICAPAPAEARNLWELPNVLLQKFPGPHFSATAKLKFTPAADGDATGLVAMGMDYASLSVRRKGDVLELVQAVAKNADRGSAEKPAATLPLSQPELYLRVTVGDGAKCRFSYSTDGAHFDPIGEEFTARPGRWIGAKIGLYATGPTQPRESGYADYDWFHIE